MSVVIDANVAIKWIVLEELRPQARALLAEEERLEAPDFMLAEVTNVAWAKQRQGLMTVREAEEGIRFIRNQIATFHSSRALSDRALTLAIQLDHPAYDCFYLACAEASGSMLVTADRALCDVAARGGLGHRVRHLADIPP